MWLIFNDIPRMVKLINLGHKSYPSILQIYFEDLMCVRYYAGSPDTKMTKTQSLPWTETVGDKDKESRQLQCGKCVP